MKSSNRAVVVPSTNLPVYKTVPALVMWGILAICFWAMIATSHGATVTLLTSDGYQESSFNSALHWSDSTAPSNVNDYIVSGLTLNTSFNASSLTFAGGSLTVQNNGSVSGSLFIRPSGPSNLTYTISNLTLSGGVVTVNPYSTGSAVRETLAGRVYLGSGGGTFSSNHSYAGLLVTSTVSGTGTLTLSGANYVNPITITLSAANNYSGGTVIGSADGKRVNAVIASNLGSGSVTVLGVSNASNSGSIASTLVLNNANTMATMSTLTLGDATSSNWLLNLNYSGITTISNLVVNGVQQASGFTYGATGSGADFVSSQFAGTGLLTVPGTTVTLTTDDALGTSSFNSVGHWSNGVAPTAGKVYINSGFTLRTPASASSYTFAANELRILGGGQLLIKSTNTGATITVNNLILDNGIIRQNAGFSYAEKVAGGIILGGGGGKCFVGLTNPTATMGLTLSSSITGTGSLLLANGNSGTNTLSRLVVVTLSGANAYSGGTTIGTTNGQPIMVNVASNSSFGAGNVNVLGYANASTVASTLILNGGTSMATTSTLTLGNATSSNWLLNLNYAGTATISHLIVNGVAQPNGFTYGSPSSSADYVTSQITGSGTLTVLPAAPAQPNLPTNFGDNFNGYSAGASPVGFSLASSGATNSWAITAGSEYQATVGNSPGIGGAFGGTIRGLPFVGGANTRNFTYSSTVRVVSASAGTFKTGLVAMAGAQPYYLNKNYYYAGMDHNGNIFLQTSNTNSTGLTLGTATHLGSAMAIGTNYTFTLKGIYSGSALALVFTVTDGVNTASLTGTAATPLTGVKFGYQVNSSAASSNATVAFDNFNLNVPMGTFTLTLDEEFSGSVLDTSVWSTGLRTADVLNPPQEIQGYVPENVLIGNGVCTFKCEKRTVQITDMYGNTGATMNYASGAIQTYDKWRQAYGYFEARMKMPSGKGFWPAFWMMPDRGPAYTNTSQRVTVGDSYGGVSVPMGNEIDIVEYMSTWKNSTTGLALSHIGYIWNYTNGASIDYALAADGFGGLFYYANPDTEFHTYSVYWAPGVLVYYLDGKVVRTWTSTTTVAVAPGNLILNCAISTDDWRSTPITLADIDASLPAYTVVDYVRVWSLNP